MCKPRHTPEFWEQASVVDGNDEFLLYHHPTEDHYAEVPIGQQPNQRGTRLLTRRTAQFLGYNVNGRSPT